MTFTYDGDGKRVMSVIGTTTTYSVGNIYEKTGESETKYYHAGGSPIDPGTRVPGTCDGGLTPPRGATTVVTDASGNLISELRYSPWGETRYSSGVTATAYTFTGPLRLASQGLALAAGSGRAAQYSNVGDFGLLFYNARWYDPSLGRFASADTIVPLGIQGYDRYAYANNSPLMFTDPTGHFGKHNDDKSDYWNKRNQGKVKQLEAKWEKEEAAKGLAELLKAASMETSLDPTASLGSLFAGFGGGKGMYGPASNALNGGDSPFVAWLTRTFTWVGKGLPLSWFMDQGANGLRVIALDAPHGSVDYWHLNSDLIRLQGINHLNIEPAHLFSVFAGWAGGTITDPFLPVPMKFLIDGADWFPPQEIIA